MSGNIRLTQILLKRGNTAAASSYIGPVGEVVIDTDLRTIRIQDGVTAGGHIITSNSNVGNVDLSSVNSNITAILNSITGLTSNAATQQTQLNTLTANAASQSEMITALMADLGTANDNIAVLEANAVSQQTAINSINSAGYVTSSDVTSAISTAINNLINSAPGTLDTLAEIAANLATEGSAISAITTSITNLQTQITNANSVQATLTNKTINAQVGTGNHIQIQGQDLVSYAGSGGVVLFQENPTVNNLWIGNGKYLGFSSDNSLQTTAYPGPEPLNAANTAIATLQTQVYTNSNVASYLPTYTGNISVTNINSASFNLNIDDGIRSGTFQFLSGGMNVPGGMNLSMGCLGQAGNNFTIGAFSNNNIQIQTNYANETWTFQTDGQLVLPLSTQGGINAGWITSSGNIGFNAGGNLWRFGNDGTMTSPYNVRITTSGIQYADGSTQTTAYGDANVAAYLPTDPTITSLQANITAANTAVATANTAMKSYVDTRIAASSYGDANVAAYLPTYSGNISAGNVSITTAASRLNLAAGAYISGDTTGRPGSIILMPNTAASSFPGVQIGGAGRINAPNGSTHMILNTADVTIQVPLKLNTGTVSTSTTTGAIQVSGGVGITGNTYIGGNVGLTSNATVWGDFSNSTVNYRTIFQTSTLNGTTGIYAVPNGTSTGAAWQATNNSNLTNASKIMITTNGTTDVQLVSGINGTGTYLPLSFLTNGTTQMQLSTAGNLTMSNGGNIVTTGNVYATGLVGANSNVTLVSGNYSTAFDSTGNITLANTGNVYINGSNIGGNILIDPVGPGNIWLVGNTYVTGTITGTVSSATASSTASSIGFLGLPQNSQGTNYGLVVSDAGKHIYVSATSTVTIPTYTSVNFPIGTTITFIAGPSATATIAITTDTMYLAGTGTTGSRTLAPYGMATAIKVAQSTWFINGVGLT